MKVAGKRAYSLARRGEEVELTARPVDVYRIDLLRYEHPEAVLEIECGSGTYVRSIGRDLGERLGCGALMCALERTAIGPFTVEAAVEIDALSRETLPELMLPAAMATVKTTSAVRVLVLPSREFRQLLRTSSAIQGKVLQAVAERLGAML